MALSPQERKGLLLMVGYTVRRLGRELGVSHTLVSFVVNDKHRNERIEKEVARLIGRPMVDVFPPKAA